MGASTSTEQIPEEQKQAEAEAASTGALPLLRNAFSKLSDPTSHSIPLTTLQQCFRIEHIGLSCESETALPNSFAGLLDQFGPCVADYLFALQKGGLITWIEFVRGYVRCCGRVSVSSLLNALFKVIASSANKAGTPLNLAFDDLDEVDSKASGSVTPKELGMILWLCWIMSFSSRRCSSSEDGEEKVALPDVNHLISSAIVTCLEKDKDEIDFDVWDSSIVTSLEVELSIVKIHMWAIKMVPNLANCFSQFVHAKILRAAADAENATGGTSSSAIAKSAASPSSSSESHLLTCGRAWSISLSQRSTISEEMQNISFPKSNNSTYDSLLYQSSHHGKGMNRFWSSMEGYHAPLLILISACSVDTSGVNAINRRWIVGALTQQGFENKDAFYGSGGYLYAVYPVFHLFSHSGKEKNYMYSRLHSTGKVYDPCPKPVGIGFGGSIGNERIFIDEDFSKLTIRHHATDKTYQPGSLFPNQGYLSVEATISDVEVWGLGGKSAKDVQLSYKKREELFTDQRRMVDLKTFASWEDSPEKMMMDMVGDPSSVRREDR